MSQHTHTILLQVKYVLYRYLQALGDRDRERERERGGKYDNVYL